MLGLVFGLEKSKIWTLGNKNLILVIDHKPILGLLKNKDLGSIANPRLAKLAEKTLRWAYTLQHIPGVKNMSADALSRFPCTKVEPLEDIVEGNIGVINEDKLVVTVEDVRKETEKDNNIKEVINLLQTSINKS